MKRTLTVLLLLTTIFFTALNVEARRRTPQGRIAGGSIAEDGTVPYMASIQHRWGHFCGAAIIDEEWIVTAAHCVVNKNPRNIKVFTGVQDFERSNEAVYYYVDRMYVHCNYDSPRQANDIALIHLNDTIELNEYTAIIPLATAPLTEGDTVTLTGWGHESQYEDIVDRLKTIDFKYVPYEECKAAHNNKDVYMGHICSFSKRGEGSCFHDSGGPLVNDGILVGVVNWGEPCGVGLPDVYSSIYYYYNWLRTIMSGTYSEDDHCNAFVKENNKI